jgi:hypothetical protein
VSPEVVAALLGVIVGVMSERIARMIGRLTCEASEWDVEFMGARDGFGQVSVVEPENAEEKALGVDYRFAIDLFNGKEVPTGLRDIAIEIVRADGNPLISRPRDLASIQPDPLVNRPTVSSVDVINLPPRQFVHKDLFGSFDREGAVALASGRWKRVEFVGARPRRPLLGILGSKTYRKVITTP